MRVLGEARVVSVLVESVIDKSLLTPVSRCMGFAARASREEYGYIRQHCMDTSQSFGYGDHRGFSSVEKTGNAWLLIP
jgi:hypothetical protein